MNGNSIFIDTNIILYLLNGDDTIAELLRSKDIYVSVISELELLSYQGIKQRETTIIEDFLSHCIIVDLNPGIKKNTITLKRKHRIKLPDAIIAASAQYVNIPLLSADKGFDKIEGIQFILYELN